MFTMFKLRCESGVTSYQSPLWLQQISSAPNSAKLSTSQRDSQVAPVNRQLGGFWMVDDPDIQPNITCWYLLSRQNRVSVRLSSKSDLARICNWQKRKPIAPSLDEMQHYYKVITTHHLWFPRISAESITWEGPPIKHYLTTISADIWHHKNWWNDHRCNCSWMIRRRHGYSIEMYWICSLLVSI